MRHGHDGRNERRSTKERQKELDSAWTQFRAKNIDGGQLLDRLVNILKIRPRISDADLDDGVDYDIYEDQ